MKNEMWLIWKEPIKRRRYKIGILTKKDYKYEFKYINPELNDAKLVGFDYYPGFDDTNKTYENEKLFTNISNRLPNPNRPDYLEILNAYNLTKDSSELEILEATKGRLVTDNYEFVPTFDLNKIEFDIAGTSHCKEIEKCKDFLNINNKLFLEPDINNEHDEFAIKVIYIHNNIKYHLGYVPRYYSKELYTILKKNINYSAMIKNLNLNSELNDENITASVKLIFNT